MPMLPINTPKIYLDYAASTPLDPRVLDAMLPHFKSNHGNSSSVHTFGQKAESAVETSRRAIAELINCTPSEIIFTACGSESDNLALQGRALAARQETGANHILISPVEHHAISHTAELLGARFGFELEYLPVDSFGRVSPEDVAARLRKETAVVSVIYANNEIGTINPISAIGEICREHGIAFHTDAVQAAAHLPIDTQTLNADLISIGAHKFYGPKGVGALYIRGGVTLQPLFGGGAQEYGLRPGTANVPYIAGMAEAFKLSNQERSQTNSRLSGWRDKIIQGILENIPDAKLTGHSTDRLPNLASFVFKGVDGNELLILLDQNGFACSSGSACKTGNPEPSEVLTAVGLDQEWALGSLRVSLGKPTTEQEVDQFLAAMPGLISSQRVLETL